MKKIFSRPAWGMLFVVMILAACSPDAFAQSTTATPATFTDPFAYCAAVGTVDQPGARYTGDTVPTTVIDGFKKAAGLESSTEPLDMLKKTTIWRCMDGKVYACNFGANLPCDSKANTSQTPTQDMAAYCSDNPNTDLIPMSVTGHASIYSWHCVNGGAVLLAQIETPDPQGYLAGIWYAIQP